MATGQPRQIGKFLVTSRRCAGGDYIGIVGDGTGYAVHITSKHSGRGAKDRAWNSARLWAEAKLSEEAAYS